MSVFALAGPRYTNPTKLGMMIEYVCTLLAPTKHVRLWRIVSPLWGAEILGVNLIPQNWKTLDWIRPNFDTWPHMKLSTIDKTLVKKLHNGYASVGRLYAEILVKCLVLGSHTSTHAPIGMKFGVKESVDSSTPHFIPIGATCRPVAPEGQITSKSPLWVTEMPSPCAAN